MSYYNCLQLKGYFQFLRAYFIVPHFPSQMALHMFSHKSLCLSSNNAKLMSSRYILHINRGDPNAAAESSFYRDIEKIVRKLSTWPIEYNVSSTKKKLL